MTNSLRGKVADNWGTERMLAKVGRNGSSYRLQDVQKLPINEEDMNFGYWNNMSIKGSAST